jgi:hypothetical protein
VLPAINLYDQQLFQTAEVRDVQADGILAAKLDAQLPAAEPHPEFMLRISFIAAEPPGQIASKLRWSAGDFGITQTLSHRSGWVGSLRRSPCHPAAAE